MNKLAVQDYLSSLHQQVAVSVDRLKSKSSAFGKEQPAEDMGYSFANGRLNAKAYTLLQSEVSYQLLKFRDEGADSSYATRSYEAAAQVNRPSGVLIDFMFKNNRDFDFKV